MLSPGGSEAPRGGGGGSEAKTKFVYLKSASNFRPLYYISFFSEDTWGGGSAGADQGPEQPPPPAPRVTQRWPV